MNAAVNDEMNEAPASPEGPGRRLKMLRQAQELDIARVATLLHLSVDKLEALEADDYDRLPGSVFTQGYIRNYARLLGVQAEPLLNAYHRVGADQTTAPILKISQVQHEVRSSHFLIRLMTWIIVIGLVALVVVWWRGYLQWPGTGFVGADAPEMPAASDEAIMAPMQPAPEEAEPAPVPEMEAGGEALLDLPPPQEEEEEPAPGPAVPEAPAAAPVADSDTTPAATGAPLAAPVETAAETESSRPEPVAVPSDRVIVRFNGTSWTQVRDANGRSLFMGEMKAGDERVLEGQPPYQMVLGNAGVVEVTVGGRPFDITPYIRGNVARLTLDPSRIR